MEIIKSYAAKNECYQVARKITPKGLMLHSVGVPQPSAKAFATSVYNQYMPNGAEVCVHAFLQSDGTVYQILPWDYEGWHCGSGSKGSANKTHIGVEMCEPDTIRYTGGASFTASDKAAAQAYVKGAYKTAVELFAYLCKLYKLDPLADGVILSHAEGNKRGVASNHADPEHLWKGLGLSYTMDAFRRDVKSAMGGTAGGDKPAEPAKPLYRVRKTWSDAKSQLGAFESLNNAKKACIAGYKVFDSAGKAVYTPFAPYTVRPTCDVLNIRKDPGTNYDVSGQIKDKGLYTIVEERPGTGSEKGWGRLKSGAGWIALDWVKRE